jgi:hypothetical protein
MSPTRRRLARWLCAVLLLVWGLRIVTRQIPREIDRLDLAQTWSLSRTGRQFHFLRVQWDGLREPFWQALAAAEREAWDAEETYVLEFRNVREGDRVAIPRTVAWYVLLPALPARPGAVPDHRPSLPLRKAASAPPAPAGAAGPAGDAP